MDDGEWVSTSRGNKRGRARRGRGGNRSRPRGGRRGRYRDNYNNNYHYNQGYNNYEEEKHSQHSENTQKPQTKQNQKKKGYNKPKQQPELPSKPDPIFQEPSSTQSGSAWDEDFPDFLQPSHPKEVAQPVPEEKSTPNEQPPSPQAEESQKEQVEESKKQENEPKIENEVKVENEPKVENTGKEESKGVETEEQRKKREEEEQRTKEIEILEKQIQDEEAQAFGWEDLEVAMEKQRYIDSLKEELKYLKNPKLKRKKKKKPVTNQNNLMVNIFKPQLSKNSIVKEQLMTEKSVKLCNDPDFEISNIKLDKLYKGMFNRSNNCFMNVILQSLYSIPVFYNFLIHLSHQVESNPLLREIFNNNQDDSLLIANFIELVKYFDPETGAPTNMLHYSDKVINVEEVFKTLLMNFNPDRQQQDCHEFLGLMLDTLNNELHEILEKVGISTKNSKLTETGEDILMDEWSETGKKKVKVHNKAQELIKNSPIFEIFGGCMREDICVEGKKTDSARLQPYLYLSLSITMDCSIESSLNQYFEPEELEGFKFGKKDAYATKTHSLLTVPNILVLQLKRFLYFDGPIKTGENVYYPDILELKDEYFAPEIQEQRKRTREALKAKQEAKSKPSESEPAKAQEEEKQPTEAPKKKKNKKKGKTANPGVQVQVHEQTEEEKMEFKNFAELEKYELIGVIVHKGKSVAKGHYICFAQDSYGNWILYDDKECKPVTSNIVMDQQAYVLIYRKFT